MASRSRRARVALGVIALAIIGLGVWRGEALYWVVMTKRKLSTNGRDSPPERGWATVTRWSGKVYGRYVIYYVETGFMATDGELNSEGNLVKYTHWNPDGTVVNQDWLPSGELEMQFKEGPPWWWGVTDQTEPSIPAWRKDDE